MQARVLAKTRSAVHLYQTRKGTLGQFVDNNFVLIAEALVLSLYNVSGACSCFVYFWGEDDSALGNECASDGYVVFALLS